MLNLGHAQNKWRQVWYESRKSKICWPKTLPLRHYHFLYCKNGGLKILIKSEMGHIANDVSVKNLN